MNSSLRILSLITALSLFSLSATAAPLYRFIDDDGTTTLSRSLPPHIAPKGYDILDENTMRLIERVPPVLTEAERAEQQRLEREAAAQRAEAEISAREAAEARRLQRIYDRNLLSTYQSEAELISVRDTDLQHRQQRIERLQATLPKLENQLREQQRLAAESELSGRPVSDNLKRRISVLEQEINHNQVTIANQQNELEQLELQYETERLRLLELLAIRNDN
ncbi:MAG: DUF4124 domain-containing protein [Methylophaga sp.]|nr:DUF4124 domain-containing protein [Methylophaga sp.]